MVRNLVSEMYKPSQNWSYFINNEPKFTKLFKTRAHDITEEIFEVPTVQISQDLDDYCAPPEDEHESKQKSEYDYVFVR